jgi:biotin operon repressor
MIEEEEVWCNDGRGSWRRKGASIEDRKLVHVFERRIFEHKTDFLKVLPKDLPDPFSNKDLAESLGISVNQSRKMTYSLRRIGTITHVGKNGNQMLFARASTIF